MDNEDEEGDGHSPLVPRVKESTWSGDCVTGKDLLESGRDWGGHSSVCRKVPPSQSFLHNGLSLSCPTSGGPLHHLVGNTVVGPEKSTVDTVETSDVNALHVWTQTPVEMESR